MSRIDEAGYILANNFCKLGLQVTYVKGVEHLLGDTFYFNVNDMSQYNERHIKSLLEKIAVFCHADMQFGKTTEAHFKVEWKYTSGGKLYLSSIIDDYNVNIGKDTDNHVINIDFEKAPHLLVAGTTGSGKSVLLKTLFVSLCNYHCHYPNSRFLGAQFVIIDPKGTEFNEFRNIGKYIDNTQSAIRALSQLVDIMENRYRNMDKVKTPIYIIIDELADLMLTSRFEVEQSIVRIAQKGRACGMHLIVATQRPSVDVVSGLIKANLPCRLALKTAGVRDSVVILDHKGAEALVGNGDCIFKNGLEEKHFKVAYPDQDLINRVTLCRR